MRSGCPNRRRRVTVAFLAGVVAVQLISPALAQDTTPPVYNLQQLDVVGVSPIQGLGVERSKVPANVRTLSPADLQRTGTPSLPEALERKLGSVSTADSQGNPFGASLNVRGFTASPVLGEAQGLAVYQNGMRINQPFGDVVLWDLVPNFAIDRAQAIPGANPLFGLNALGGAVSLEMKNGFNFTGGQASAAGGSFGRVDGVAEYGTRIGNVGYYAGGRGFSEDGWRDRSPSQLGQGYADIMVRRDALDLGLALTYAASDLLANGPAPEQLLRDSRSAVFTTPDVTRNQLAGLALRAAYEVSPAVSLQAIGYYRHVTQHLINGDATGNGACTGVAGAATTLCRNPGAGEAQLTDAQGMAIPATIGGNAALNRVAIATDAMGGSLQAMLDQSLLGRRNRLVVGNALDYGEVSFESTSELGTLSPSRSVTGTAVGLGGSDFNTRLDATNLYYGLYASDSYSLSEALTLTAAARLNVAELRLRDQLGGALTSTSDYHRLNPSIGVAYQVAPALGIYANYAEANRIPTAAELACADPTRPCRFPTAFVSDPPLRQVVSRSVEGGVRGGFAPLGDDSRVEWSAAVFDARNSDDIVFVSSGPILGSGFFQNAGTTERVGLELGVDGRAGPWRLSAAYGLVRATFEDFLTLRSPNNPGADANGDIHVRPGDRIPNIPLHTVKWSIGYAITDTWSVAGEWIAATGRFLRGDESNQQAQLPGYIVTNLESVYKLTANSEAFIEARNLFDQRYQTFGVYGDPSSVFPGFTDNRFVTPAQPRAVWAGARLRF